MSSLPPQSTTYTGLPIKEPLNEAFVGKRLNELRTPAFVIDRSVFARNCARMHDRAAQWGCDFRAHVKTHKASEIKSLFHRFCTYLRSLFVRHRKERDYNFSPRLIRLNRWSFRL